MSPRGGTDSCRSITYSWINGATRSRNLIVRIVSKRAACRSTLTKGRRVNRLLAVFAGFSSEWLVPPGLDASFENWEKRKRR